MVVVSAYCLLRRRDRYLRREQVFRDKDHPLSYLDDADVISTCMY